MDNKNGFTLTARDMVLRAWQNSTELVRDYQNYAKEIQDGSGLAEMFAKYSESEARHAAELLKILQDME